MIALAPERVSDVRDGAPCWCGSTGWELCFRTARFGLVRCPSCEGYRLDPRPLQETESALRFYDDFYARLIAAGYPADGGGLPDSRFWRVAAEFSPLRAPRRLAVDIGSGDGGLCGQLAAAGWPSVVGIEVSPPRLERARRAYPAIPFHRSVEEAGVVSGSADLVVMDNVIEHLLEPAVAIADAARLLNATGHLVVITPNLESGHFRLLGRRWTSELCPDQHIHLFTPPAIRRLLAGAGLQVDAIGSFHLPFMRPREWLSGFDGAPVRTTIWRAGMEAGAAFGRVIGAGPMLYAVARRAPRE